MNLGQHIRSAVHRLQRPIDDRRVAQAVAGADAILVSYPKCGRTWLRFALSCYLAELFQLGLSPDLATTFHVIPNMDSDRERGIPAFAFGAYRPGMPLILVSHRAYEANLFQHRPMIFLVRDPRDVIVSSYFHATRHKHRFSGDIGDFIRDGDQGLPALIRYWNGWAAGLEGHRTLVTSYEAMTHEPHATLARILDFLGVHIDPAIADRAIAAASFGAMRAKEKDRGIPGHRYDRSDDESLRMRKGKIGGYADYLSPAEADHVLAACRSGLTLAARALVGIDALAQVDAQPAAARV